MVTLPPLIQPSLRSRFSKAETNALQTVGVVAPRKPMVGCLVRLTWLAKTSDAMSSLRQLESRARPTPGELEVTCPTKGVPTRSERQGPDGPKYRFLVTCAQWSGNGRVELD